MVIKLITVGRLKEKYLRDAYAEYEKRLGAFCRLTLDEIEPVRLPDDPNEAQINAALSAEGEKILKKIPPDSLAAALCIEGKQLSSEALAKTLSDAAVGGRANAVFIIGSSCGLSESVKKAADIRLSMSAMTFPHQLARIMLCEQIYRAFTIINNRKYHK